MADLKAQIVRSAQELQQAWAMVKSVSGTELPAECYENWIEKASLHFVLDSTGNLFPARDTAWQNVLSIIVPENIVDASQNRVRLGSLEMEFAVARHLALTSYVAVTWAIYDRLSNVCGRLAAVAKIAQNPRQNPKACEDFLGDKDLLGFNTHQHLKDAYGWPLKISYKLRNWILHEGYSEGDIMLFSGDSIADGFLLHPRSIDHLQKCCNYSQDAGKIDSSCVKDSDESWMRRDVLEILSQYNSEVDAMFSSLVKWSVASFTGQIAAFAARDRP